MAQDAEDDLDLERAPDPIWRVVEAIADGSEPDWSSCDRESPESGIATELRTIQAVAHRHRQTAKDSPLAASIPGRGGAADLEDSAREWTWGSLRVLERVGQGAFGEVFRAYDPNLQREVALKLRYAEKVRPAIDRDQYLSEARRLARVSHPNVIAVHGADFHDGRIGLWTELLSGTTLEEHLRSVGRFGPSEAILIGLDLCRALAAVHSAGLLHRDVKTTNVMREDGGRIVLLDLGAGTELPRSGRMLDAGAVYGTLATVAPEVLRGDPVGPGVDLYALGVLLYRLVTGRYPIEAPLVEDLLAKHSRGEIQHLRDLRPEIPEGFVSVVERAMSPRPEDRFQSAGEMERALRACLGAGGDQGLRPRAGLGTWRVAGLLLAAMAAGGLLGYALRKEDPSEWINRIGLPGVGTLFVNETALCTASRTQKHPTLAPDGTGGAIVVWQDERNGGSDVYAQRFGNLSVPLWAPDGVPVCTAVGDQRLNLRIEINRQQVPSIVSDGAGGAIIAWSDLRGRDWDIYATRINGSGERAPGWLRDGSPLCHAPGDQGMATLVPDGAGGAIVTWGDARPGGIMVDVYAQRIDSTGTIHAGWPPDGVAVCSFDGDQQLPTIAPDGQGGAFVAWHDYRADSNADIYMQHVSAEGKMRWRQNGVAVAGIPGLQLDPMVISDGARGVLVVWRDARPSARATDIYAQHFDGDGRAYPGWPDAGLALCAVPRDQVMPVVTSDGKGGAIVAWVDHREDSQGDIYGQRVGGDGKIAWAAGGVSIRSGPGPQQEPAICSDPDGGAVVCFRSGGPNEVDGISAQRLGADGSLLWTPRAVALCRATGSQVNPHLVPARNGAIVAWTDGRSGTYKDVFAALVASTGPTRPTERRSAK